MDKNRMKNGMPLLEVKNLQTQFQTENGIVRAVAGISFEIYRREALGVVGESGSGKSVSALSLMRLIPCPPGRITADRMQFDGKELLALSEKKMREVRGGKIAMIFQDPMTSLNPVLRVGFQIKETLRVHMGMTASQSAARCIELLKMVGIPSAEDRVNDYPHQFSGGMRQRAMIAMALACNPQLLIADEATTALDVTIQAQIIDLVQRLRRETDAAVMWITHDLGVVVGLCDRVNVMYAGHIVESAPVRGIFHRPSHGYTVGLLKSVPRLDRDTREPLEPIRGTPPDLIEISDVCPFLPRCTFAVDACHSEAPPMRQVGDHHIASCWANLEDHWREGRH
jgi:oligopeptide transport system ATP-binding protein